MTRNVGLWIDHREQPAENGATLPVENPATEETIGCVPRAQGPDVARAVACARTAARSWRRVPGLEKAALLHAVADRIRAMRRELAEWMTLEGGKPMIENLDEIEWTTA